MSDFWCCGCQQSVDEEFDGFGEVDGKWYCKLCAEELRAKEANILSESEDDLDD